MTPTATGRSRSAASGLTSGEAAARLVTDGPNVLRMDIEQHWYAVVLRQLRDVVVLVLLVAAVLTAAVGDVSDMTVILAVIVLNTALAARQELRSGKALAALATLTAPQASVLRDGVPLVVPAAEVVRGDTLLVAAGDIVAADARLASVESLQVDESVLTGESVPAGKLDGDVLQAGTVVTRGSGRAVVTATGQHTALGRIGAAISDREPAGTPLQRQLATLGRQLALAVSVAALLVGVLELVTGHSLELSIVIALSLAVAAIPESLPAVVAVSLALAARRMAACGVLVRRLAAVEALGSVTVVAVDKTGTITEGRMAFAGSSPTEDAEWLLIAAVLCNDAPSVDEPTARDDPTEVALVRAAHAAGIDVEKVRDRHPRTAVVPFDAASASMTTTHLAPDGTTFSVCKGAPEVIGALVGRPSAVEVAAAPFLAGGARVLGVAMERDGSWQLLGVLGLADPPRAEAADTVRAFHRAGIRVVMITGDHPHTARAVAARAGITTPAEDTAGCVFARVPPDGKAAIVRELRRSGEIVAMTGDGVNDAPALRAADVGLAMGRRGTEVAKHAADLVLTEDDLSALVPTIAEGRRAWDNLRRFLLYALSGGIAEVAIMLVGPTTGFALPLQAGQILWVNLLTHGLPGVALGNEPAAEDVLRRPPRHPGARLLDRPLAARAGALGTVVAACALMAGGLASSEYRTPIFLTLALAQLGVALAVRPSWRAGRRNPSLLIAVTLNALLMAAAIWWPPLRELLHTQPIGHHDLLVSVLLAAIPAGVVVAARRWNASSSMRS